VYASPDLLICFSTDELMRAKSETENHIHMRTMRDLKNAHVLAMACFLSKPEVLREEGRRINEIGKILAEDLKITWEEAADLPDDHLLSERAEKAFDDMTGWLSSFSKSAKE